MTLNLSVNIECDERALRKVGLSPSKNFHIHIQASHFLKKIVLEWMEAYLAKEPIPALLPFYFPEKTSLFMRAVLEKMKEIPFGEVCCYKDLNFSAPRAVGRVCHVNPFPLFYPCHRVIAKKGLGGFAYGFQVKKELLSFEGFLNS